MAPRNREITSVELTLRQITVYVDVPSIRTSKAERLQTVDSKEYKTRRDSSLFLLVDVRVHSMYHHRY